MRVTSDQIGTGAGDAAQLALIRNVAEDLKLPLARVLSYASETHTSAESGKMIRHTIESTVDFIDTYILCIQVQSGQQSLNIQPVALAPLFDEAAHQLSPLAKLHGFDISVSVTRATKTVLSDKLILQKLLTMLGYSFLQSTTRQTGSLHYCAHKNSDFIRAGVFSNSMDLKKGDLQAVRQLKGRASLLSKTLPYGVSAGVAIADLLAQVMNSSLQPLRLKAQTGLGVELLPSSQLKLL